MTAQDRVVGVIGGMGPDATIDFMSRVLLRTPADVDQDHVRMLVDHNPRIPSRQLAMKGEGEDPGSTLGAIAAGLEAGGAQFIVMPCNLAHAWESNIRTAIDIPFVSIVDVSVSEALKSVDDGPIGVMTTPGCFKAGLYQRALSNRELVLQTEDELTAAMALVERIKAGEKSEGVSKGLRELGTCLMTRGARTLIAACTEFPLVLDESMFSIPFVSSTDVLAEKTVSLALCREPLPGP